MCRSERFKLVQLRVLCVQLQRKVPPDIWWNVNVSNQQQQQQRGQWFWSVSKLWTQQDTRRLVLSLTNPLVPAELDWNDFFNLTNTICFIFTLFTLQVYSNFTLHPAGSDPVHQWQFIRTRQQTRCRTQKLPGRVAAVTFDLWTLSVITSFYPTRRFWETVTSFAVRSNMAATAQEVPTTLILTHELEEEELWSQIKPTDRSAAVTWPGPVIKCVPGRLNMRSETYRQWFWHEVKCPSGGSDRPLDGS